jgi:hypothetical protein
MSHGHDFECAGGAGGWEVWECRRCQRSTMPGPIPFLPLWPEILGTLFKRWRCSRAADQSRETP